MDLKVLITVFQKMIWFSGIWATVHMQLKYQKWCWLSRNLNLNSSNSNTNISKTLSHTKINNTIFWKHVTRPFRCIYVNYFNLLGFFFLRSAQNWKNALFFSRIWRWRNMKTTQITSFFSSTFFALPVCNIHFWIWKYIKFIFKFITLGHSGL